MLLTGVWTDCSWCPVLVEQWSFRKTGTMETLASQDEIGVRVQALCWGWVAGCWWGSPLPLRGSGSIPRKKFEIVCKIMQSTAILVGKLFAMLTIISS